MGTKGLVATLAALVTFGIVCPRAAHADLPAPPGVNRVSYSFRVTGSVSGVVLVAYPMYNSDRGNVLPIEPDRDWMPTQGFVPGIYAVPQQALSSILGKAKWKEDEARQIEAVLAQQGHVCIKAVPRVTNVPSSTAITSMVDVFRVEASPAGCRAAFLTTFYGGANGEAGQGGLDATGQRTPPPPFGRELPPVGDMGIAGNSTAPGPAPLWGPPGVPPGVPPPASPPGSHGCGGCVVASPQAAPLAIGAALLGVAVAAARGARRARGRQATRR